jgi:hypothetical protein
MKCVCQQFESLRAESYGGMEQERLEEESRGVEADERLNLKNRHILIKKNYLILRPTSICPTTSRCAAYLEIAVFIRYILAFGKDAASFSERLHESSRSMIHGYELHLDCIRLLLVAKLL